MKERKRLERVVRVRELVRDARAGELELARFELVTAEDHLARASEDLVRAMEAVVAPRDLTPADLVRGANVLAVERSRVESLRRDADARAEVVAVREGRASEASRELKVVERLRTRAAAVAVRDEGRREQAALDETRRKDGRR